MKYDPCQTNCGDVITNQARIDQNQISVYSRHLVNLRSNQTYFPIIDLRPALLPVYAMAGSVLFFQHLFQQNIYNGRVAVEFNASYSDFKANCTPICFTNYQINDGQTIQPWRFLLRAITAPLNGKTSRFQFK